MKTASLLASAFAVLAFADAACSDSADGEASSPAAAATPGARSEAGNGAMPSDGGASADAGDAIAPAPREVPYENPVLDGDFPDPAVLRAEDGTFYAFATGGAVLQRATSRDLVHWKRIAPAMSKKPSWASEKNAFWAPHVYERGGTYFLYFAAEQNAGSGSFCIGVATSAAMDGDFADVGKPIVCGPGFENIDAMVFDDPASGKTYLYWGSAEKPIRYRELADNRIELADGSVSQNILVPSKLPYERLIEGPWIHAEGGYFYAFYSGDDCCGSATSPPHYAVLVARAKSPLGPFEDFTSTGAKDNTMLVANARWIGPGHNAVVKDDAGQTWMVFHAFDATKPSGRNMLIDKITYANGWPEIAGRTPSSGKQPGPMIRLP